MNDIEVSADISVKHRRDLKRRLSDFFIFIPNFMASRYSNDNRERIALHSCRGCSFSQARIHHHWRLHVSVGMVVRYMEKEYLYLSRPLHTLVITCRPWITTNLSVLWSPNAQPTGSWWSEQKAYNKRNWKFNLNTNHVFLYIAWQSFPTCTIVCADCMYVAVRSPGLCNRVASAWV